MRFLERNKAKQIIKADSSFSEACFSDGLSGVCLGYPWKALSIEVLFVICRFSSFFCCLLAFSATSNVSLGIWLSAFSLSWAAGLVVPAAPGGLGVFEAVLLLRLGSMASEIPLLGILFSYRLITTGADVIAAIGVTFYRFLLGNYSKFFRFNRTL